jgi:hypothetical protein
VNGKIGRSHNVGFQEWASPARDAFTSAIPAGERW